MGKSNKGTNHSLCLCILTFSIRFRMTIKYFGGFEFECMTEKRLKLLQVCLNVDSTEAIHISPEVMLITLLFFVFCLLFLFEQK